MDSIIDLLYQLKDYLNPKILIDWMLLKLGVWVYLGLFAIVFAETGLAIGFFLPGDSLLVVAGLFAAAGKLNLAILMVTLFVAAVVGDAVGYLSGKKAGEALFTKPKSRFFNPKHLRKAHDFYEKHGGKTIIIARFVPIVRTFAPIVAGAAKMSYRTFVFYNVIGGLAWVTSMLLAGYFLGGLVEQFVRNVFGIENFLLEDHIDKVVIVVVFLSILPIIFELIKSRREISRTVEDVIDEVVPNADQTGSNV
ncbi:MAG TPA: VTT domain-containing protein [Pyrinomonadaceae bacterium]|nr:VTT domain-containing protein [Pyrinomonadaceae bacterium]